MVYQIARSVGGNRYEAVSTILLSKLGQAFFNRFVEACPAPRSTQPPPFIRSPVAGSRHRSSGDLDLLGTNGNDESVLAVSGQAPPTPCVIAFGAGTTKKTSTPDI